MSKRKTKISITTCFGFLLGIGCVFGSVVDTGNPMLFWNVPSFFIIIGGTLATLITVYPASKLKLFFSVMLRAFKQTKIDTLKDIETIVELAEVARSKGLISLEDVANQYKDDSFLHEGLLMISDGLTEEELRNRLQGIMYFTKKRHSKNASMIELVGTVAPSLGLVGTYIGLIPMLSNLDDPTSLGPMMAIELVSSFYGGVIANVLFMPLARRLKMISEEEQSRNELMMEGLICIQQGKNPRVIEDELMSFMNLKKDKKGNTVELGSKKKAKKKQSVA